jgi:hypothetical protein
VRGTGIAPDLTDLEDADFVTLGALINF